MFAVFQAEAVATALDTATAGGAGVAVDGVIVAATAAGDTVPVTGGAATVDDRAFGVMSPIAANSEASS